MYIEQLYIKSCGSMFNTITACACHNVYTCNYKRSFRIRSSNIDTRIQQAELEYQLGREELNLLSLMEETNKHKCRLDEIEQHNEQSENVTLYTYVPTRREYRIDVIIL